MVPLVPVRIGDLIEFSQRQNDPSGRLVEGRVMDVDPIASNKCAVQVSPYEDFREVDLCRVDYKVLHAVGDLTSLDSSMIGWEIEIAVGERNHCNTYECGVIKQIDTGLNCALIAFDDGNKDWRDLTMNAFKVVAKVSPSTMPSPIKATQYLFTDNAVAFTLPQLQTEGIRGCSPPAFPVPDANDFDWYTEGGHVELCDDDGRFCEGALLCSRRNNTLQLYNENRQFFEIDTQKQSFKVIIHGIVTLKSVPLGQPIDVYSPMHGEFRRGVVIKAADVGKLTPVRFIDAGVEWLDLTSQTFKLVFVTENHAIRSQDTQVQRAEIHKAEKRDRELGVHSSLKNSDVQPSARSTAPDHGQHTRSHEPSKNTHLSQLTLPRLKQGDAVELVDPMTKQFIKYRVVRTLPTIPHLYDVEPAPGSTSGSSFAIPRERPVLSNVASCTINLATVRARVPLIIDRWEDFKPILVGYRVDVYDKSDRTVLNGEVIGCSSSDDSNDGPCVHIKLKDHSKRWFDVNKTKMKLRISGDPNVRTTESPTTKHESTDLSFAEVEPLWQRVECTPAEPNVDEHKTSTLTRQQSEKVRLESPGISPLVRHASSPVNALTNGLDSGSKIPTLDFSSLARERAEPVVNVPATTESLHVEDSNASQRSTGSTGEALSDLLPAMDDLWVEEPTSANSMVEMRYVHTGTGEIQVETPQWLKKLDESTGESYILNTITGVRFQSPGSSGVVITPLLSARGAVVTLPVGPLEAARVASKMNSSTTGFDLCAEAFGS